MKIIVLSNDNPNQIALMNKINMIINLDAIVISKNITTKNNSKNTITKFINKLLKYPFELPFKITWKKLQKKYTKTFSTIPDVKTYYVDNINDSLTLKVLEEINPSLILVSGTNLIKDDIINAKSKQCMIMNLHTGISPYVRGGPNCTNWCLANREFHLIGNTIMELDVGIDSGNIIATEQTILDGNESLFEMHWKVMEHAHDLYIRAIKCYLDNGKFFPIKQSEIDKGKVFYTKDWTIKENIKAFLNYILFYKKSLNKLYTSKMIKIFPLDCRVKNR